MAFTGGDLALNNYNSANGTQTFYGADARNVFSYYALANGYTKYTWTYFDKEYNQKGVGIGTYKTTIFGNSKKGLDIAGGIYGGLQGMASSEGMWLGMNGKYNSNSWGGNQYTGSRAGAFKAANQYRIAGYAVIGVSGSNWRNRNISRLSKRWKPIWV